MTEEKLLTRDEFRESVFKRDRYMCCFPMCEKKADDAHHIIERRLWTDDEKGGYYTSNGASVCEYHHQYGAESCMVHPQTLRHWCGIKEIKVPKQLRLKMQAVDKWGIILKGPGRLHIKYPSTVHLSWSDTSTDSSKLPDKQITDEELMIFLNQPLIITKKMDGSNVCLTREMVTARNGETAKHKSFSLLKQEHTVYHHLIPKHLQVFGEYLFAKHSIHYTGNMAVESYLQIFSVYDQETEMFLGWDSVENMSVLLGIPTVPILEKKTFTNKQIMKKRIMELSYEMEYAGHEGIVVRTEYPFHYGAYESYITTNEKTEWRVIPIVKFVRFNHNINNHSWKKDEIIKNEVRLEHS